MRNTPTLKPVWCYFRNTGFPSARIIFSFYPPDVQVTEEPFVTHVTTWYNSNLIAEYSTVTCYITVTEKCNVITLFSVKAAEIHPPHGKYDNLDEGRIRWSAAGSFNW